MPKTEIKHRVARIAQLRNLLQDDDTYMTTLIVICSDLYGYEFMEWSPETIKLQLYDDMQVEVPSVNLSKIMAGIAVLTTDSFYRNLPRFIQLCNVIADQDYNPFVFDPADSFEMAWAITEVLLLDPPEDPSNAFTDEIRSYMGFVVQQEGIVNPPDVLAIAMNDRRLDDPINVGNEGEDPEMYAAFWQNQAAKGDEIRTMLTLQVGELIKQITSLPLTNGNVDGLLSKMRKALHDKDETNSDGFL